MLVTLSKLHICKQCSLLVWHFWGLSLSAKSRIKVFPNFNADNQGNLAYASSLNIFIKKGSFFSNFLISLSLSIPPPHKKKSLELIFVSYSEPRYIQNKIQKVIRNWHTFILFPGNPRLCKPNLTLKAVLSSDMIGTDSQVKLW